MADVPEVTKKASDKGTYILLARLDKSQKIKPGRLPEAIFERGTYLYIGRARSGLAARIKRHIRRQKKVFWHIDYLLQKAKVVDIWVRQGFFAECRTAREIRNFRPETTNVIQGFGSSDCRCPGHLYYFPPGSSDLRSLKNKIGFKKETIDGDNI